MNFRERRKELSAKMRYIGETDKEIKKEFFLMYNPLGIFLKRHKATEKIVHKTYQLIRQERREWIKNLNTRIDYFINKSNLENLKYLEQKHNRKGMNLN